jgi:hypothetical protein
MSNVFTQMLARIDPQVFGEVLRQESQNQPGLTNPKQQILSPSIEEDKVRRQQQEMDQRQEGLRGVDHGMREFAPIAGLLKGLAANMQRGKDNEDLDVLYGNVMASQEAEREQQAQAKAADEQKKAAAAEASYQRTRADGQADAERDSGYKIAEKNAEHRAIKANRQPVQATNAEVKAGKVDQIMNSAAPMQEKIALVAQIDPTVATSLMKIEESRVMETKKGQESGNTKALLSELLSPDNATAMKDATGNWQGSSWYPTSLVNQDATTWQNKYEGLTDTLTLGNLDRMTGVLSESDIKLLRAAASGGMALTSDTATVQAQLEAIQRYYQAEEQMGATEQQAAPQMAGNGPLASMGQPLSPLSPEEQSELEQLRARRAAGEI